MEEKKKKVIIFPHAGAGTVFFNSFKEEFKNSEVYVIQYPGREDKYGQSMPDTINQLADVLFAEYKHLFKEQFVFWGHSMGSIHNVPIRFFSSGSSAPCSGSSEGLRSAVKSQKDFESLLDIYGGISDELKNDSGFCKYFYPIILGDMKIISNYCDDELVKLCCPIMLMEGIDDSVRIDEWKLYTDFGIEVKYFEGGHFFIDEHKREIAASIENYYIDR